MALRREFDMVGMEQFLIYLTRSAGM